MESVRWNSHGRQNTTTKHPHYLSLTHLGQRNGQRTDPTSTVADRLASNITISLDPIQNLFNGLTVSISDIHLHRIDLVTLTVNLVPAAESLRIEILADFCLVVNDV